MTVDAFDSAFVEEDLVECVERTGVASVVGRGGLDNETGADKVERGEEEACDEVRSYRKEDVVWARESRYGRRVIDR